MLVVEGLEMVIIFFVNLRGLNSLQGVLSKKFWIPNQVTSIVKNLFSKSATVYKMKLDNIPSPLLISVLKI